MHVQHPTGSKHNGIAPLPEIIICINRRDGLAHAAELGRPSRDFIFITVRSSTNVRGRNATAIHETDDAREHPAIERLRAIAKPALATRRS